MKYTSICENHLFAKAYQSGSRFTRRTLCLYVLTDKKAALLRKQNPEKKKINRLGITVSKKLGGAVERTRARRLLRESYRLLEKEEPTLTKGKLLVVVARSAIGGSKMQAVKADLRSALSEAGLLS